MVAWDYCVCLGDLFILNKLMTLGVGCGCSVDWLVVWVLVGLRGFLCFDSFNSVAGIFAVIGN